MKNKIQRTKVLTDYISAKTQLDEVKIPSEVIRILQQSPKTLQNQVDDIRDRVRDVYLKIRHLDSTSGEVTPRSVRNELHNIFCALNGLNKINQLDALSEIVNQDDLWKGYDIINKQHGDGK